MSRSRIFGLFLLVTAGLVCTQAQMKTSVLLQSTDDDERIELSIDKSVYVPGDTVRLSIARHDTVRTSIIMPILDLDGAGFKSIGRRAYIAVIPETVTPGSYPVRLRVSDSEGRRFRYETDCLIVVEEFEDVELLSRYVCVVPFSGSDNIRNAVTLDREQIRNLMVRFQRDSIRVHMGPQFVRITTTIRLRDDMAAPSYERRVVTFRSHGDTQKDRAMFTQYRAAYGVFANIRPEELEQVLVPVDSLPDWAILGIRIEPDYTIKIGAVDRSNSMTRYFRVRGPTLEIGFALAIPKVLFDSRANDTIQYGNTSAMVRFYYVDGETGNRFPVSAGIGMFGVNSPVDVGTARGGFAVSMFLDMAEMVRIVNIGFTKKINFGLEIAPFLPIGRKGRLLFVAQAGFTF